MASQVDDKTRTGTNDEVFAEALRRTVGALEGAGVPHVFMGGIASMVHGRTCWTHDIDIFCRPADEPDAMAALETAGLRRAESEHVWLSKAYWGDVLVDVVHRSEGPVYADDDMFARAVRREVWGTEVGVMAAEDLIVTKALAHTEETQHYWWDVLAIIAGCELDWDYLIHRARRGPRRVLSLLVYAQSVDLAVPDPVVRKLADLILPPSAS